MGVPSCGVARQDNSQYCSGWHRSLIWQRPANAELRPLVEQFAKQTPTHFPKKFRVRVKGLNDRFVEHLGQSLFLLFGAVALLLVIGCANVPSCCAPVAQPASMNWPFAAPSARVVGAFTSNFRLRPWPYLFSARMDPAGQYMAVIDVFQGRTRLLKVPLEGGQEREIPIAGNAALPPSKAERLAPTESCSCGFNRRILGSSSRP
jgi:hypothetical protein